jgi:small ligand-binding sensory domain FIST
VLFFADPHAFDGRAMASGLGAVGAAALAGVATGESFGSPQPVWVGDEVVHGAVAALRLQATERDEARISLTQAGRPVGEPMRITRAQGHWILGLEGGSALEAYRQAAPAPLRDDLPRASRSMLVALEAAPEGGEGSRGRRVRNVVGFDEARGAFSVAEAPLPGDRLALLALDSVAARDELGRLGARLAGPTPAGALYLNCRARAGGLFEHEGYELGEVGRLLGGAPVLGMMGSQVYGRSAPHQPVELHTYAAIAALVDQREP